MPKNLSPEIVEDDDSVTIVPVDNDALSPLRDFRGDDAFSRQPLEVREEVQRYAIALLPEVLMKMTSVVKSPKSSNKDIIEAAKFIKSVADGDLKPKDITNAARKMSDSELAEIIND